MSLNFSPLFSSSAGNCSFFGTERTKLLIDAGATGGTIEKALCEIGQSPAELSAILITHEHIDHIRGAGVLSRRYGIPVYANAATWQEMLKKVGDIPLKNMRTIDGAAFYVGDVCVQSVPLSHDAADPVGYALMAGGKKMGVLTDTGKITEEMLRAMEKASIVLLESNHDPDMLKNSRYPYRVKSRIAGSKGHLNNSKAAETCMELARRGVRGIILGHVSRENNHKQLAYETSRSFLTGCGVQVGQDIALTVARRTGVTGFFTVK